MKSIFLHHRFLEISGNMNLFAEPRLAFYSSSESLHVSDKFQKKEELSVGDKAVETHERAEKSKGRVEKSPLRKFIKNNPDSEIASADESRNESIANAVSSENHETVSAMLTGNIPQDVGEKVAGSLMNDYA